MKNLNRQTARTTKELPVRILQFGEGNFLRGFVDWIIDILNENAGFDSGVVVIQPIEHGIIDLINQQDGLYHVLLNGLLKGEEIENIRLITAVKYGLDPHKNYNEYLQQAENPDLKFIFSNTTEAGITFDGTDAQDVSKLPKSFPGKLTVLLYHRFKHFNGNKDKGLYIIPCELIEKNGEVLQNTILKYAAHYNMPAPFSEWLKKNVIFCNTLVDRIVPGFPRENISQIQENLGFKDNLVVKAEPFHLWVIEGPEILKNDFPTEKVGLQVKFVNDLAPYRTRKVRILNGAHTALVPVAYLHGLRTVRESVEDKKTGEFLKEVIFKEIVPTLDLPAEELHQFANDVIERFQNPFIRHELISIALNSISKYKVRVLPSVLEYIKRKDQLPNNLLHSLACLIVFYKGSWNGELIELNDTHEILSFFNEAWRSNDTGIVVKKVLTNKSFWDIDLTAIPGLEDKVLADVEKLLARELNHLKTA